MQNGEKYITFLTYIHIPTPSTLPLIHPPCPSAPAPPFPPTSFFTQPRKPFSHSWSHLLFTFLVWELHICLSTCKTHQSTFNLIISMMTAPVESRVLACPVREFPARSPNLQNWFLSSPGFTHLSKCRDIIGQSSTQFSSHELWKHPWFLFSLYSTRTIIVTSKPLPPNHILKLLLPFSFLPHLSKWPSSLT